MNAPSSEPLVSVIIPSWERKKDILATLESLRKQTYSNREIIVVDQASTDGGPEEIEKNFPEAKLIRLQKNIGPGSARNLGAEQALGEILVFIDNDDDLDVDAICQVVNRFCGKAAFGILGFKICDARTHELDIASWTYPKWRLKDADTEFETYIFCGGGYAMPKKVFLEGARYWDLIFWLAEEWELSMRVIKMGYRILYNPRIKIYHRASPERRLMAGPREAQGLRNCLWITWKYFPFWSAVGATFLRAGAYLIKGLRNRFFFHVIWGIFGALRRIDILFFTKDRLSKARWRHYKTLSYQGPWLEALRRVFMGGA